jgi:two-component system, cell cycle sensor histidine kinase and response regulator CckA
MISEQHTGQAQASRMEALGRLAGGVAHDFNNLLTIIVGYGEMIDQSPTASDQVRKDVRILLEAAKRAGSLTRQLLLFSRRQALAPQTVDVDQALTSLERLLRRLIPEDIAFEIGLPAAPLCVFVDPGQFDQVVVNLAANARDAMPHGGRLSVTARHADVDDMVDGFGDPVPRGAYVVIDVADTGVGMDEATRTRIFEPFFTTKGKGKGTGLGLATVYGIVRQSGGFITVDSDVGRGSTFRVYLPQRAAVVAAATAERGETARGSETILVAEDDQVVRGIVTRALRSAGYTVLAVESGAGALDVAARHPEPIDLLLTDLVMADMAGPELARRLRSDRPAAHVLFMTAHTDHAAVSAACEQAAPAQLLHKPFAPRTMLTAVRSMLDAPRGAEARR